MNNEKDQSIYIELLEYRKKYKELLKRYEKQNDELILCEIEIAKLLLKIQDLQQRIDKTIEYLETATIDPQSMRHYRNCLLEILKGDSNE